MIFREKECSFYKSGKRFHLRKIILRHRYSGGYKMNFRPGLSLLIILSFLMIPVFGEDLTKIYGSIPKNGINQVTLDNSANDKEAVVVFKEMNWPIPFAVYLAPHQTGVLKLPSESYQVYYTLGRGWNVAEKRFHSEPEYYMMTGVFNPAETGLIHEEKLRPARVVDDTWDPDAYVPSTYGEKIDYAEWKWAESTIPLYQNTGSPDTRVPVDESDFPLS